MEEPAPFQTYMAKHFRSWVSFANRPERECNITPKELIFVTGCDRTSDWAMLAFHSSMQQMEIEFSAGAPAIASASASAWGGWMTTGSVHRNCGPSRESPSACLHTADVASTQDLSNFNQTLFVRGWHVGYRLSMFPDIIRAGAGYDELGRGNRDASNDGDVLADDRIDGIDVEIANLSGHAPVSNVHSYHFQRG